MAAFGLVTGYGELCYLAIRKYYQELFVFQPPDVLWLTPLANALLFCAAGTVGWLLLRMLRRAVTPRHVLQWASALAIMAWLFLLAPLHKGAAIVIAIGAAASIGRSRLATTVPVIPVPRRIVALLLMLVALTGFALHARQALTERGAEAGRPAPGSGAPNVVLIILDTVRAWNLSLYGYPRPTTPNLARRAADGVRFARAFATAPWTLPTHASLFTGREAHELSTSWYTPLDDSTPTLAEAFRAAGYRTGGFVANLPYTSRETGLDRGFSRFEDYPVSLRQLAGSASLVRAVSGNRTIRSWMGTHQLLVRKHAPQVTGALLDWIDEAPGRPFFAFLNYYDAHQPYVPPPDQLARFLPPGVEPQQEPIRRTAPDQVWDPLVLAGAVASYDAAIADLDREMERLFTEFERRAILANTVVIITSDHGEEFGEHGLIDHGSSLNRAALEVPLILWYGAKLPAGTVVDAPVSLRDVAATITDLAGLSADPVFPGRSLRRFWAGHRDAPSDPIFSELHHAARQPEWYPTSQGDMLSLLLGGTRYVREGNGGGSAFALADSAERIDLTADPAQASELAALRAILDSVRPRDSR